MCSYDTCVGVFTFDVLYSFKYRYFDSRIYQPLCIIIKEPVTILMFAILSNSFVYILHVVFSVKIKTI